MSGKQVVFNGKLLKARKFLDTLPDPNYGVKAEIHYADGTSTFTVGSYAGLGMYRSSDKTTPSLVVVVPDGDLDGRLFAVVPDADSVVFDENDNTLTIHRDDDDTFISRAEIEQKPISSITIKRSISYSGYDD